MSINPAVMDGLITSSGAQLLKQFVNIICVEAYAFTLTWLLGKLVSVTVGLRVGQSEESVGLDMSQHGERAYGGMLR